MYRGEPSVLLEFPIGFFCANVLLHQFGDDFVLGRQLLLQASDLLPLRLLGSPGARRGMMKLMEMATNMTTTKMISLFPTYLAVILIAFSGKRGTC